MITPRYQGSETTARMAPSDGIHLSASVVLPKGHGRRTGGITPFIIRDSLSGLGDGAGLRAQLNHEGLDGQQRGGVGS